MSEWQFEAPSWYEAGEYDGTECSNCGRSRVMICDVLGGEQRRVCEKCKWDHASGGYASTPPAPAKEGAPPEPVPSLAKLFDDMADKQRSINDQFEELMSDVEEKP